VNKEFVESIGAIRQESLGMLKNLRAVKGENYARVVHSIILADQINSIGDMFVDSTEDKTKDLAKALTDAQMNMIALIMKYFFRSSQLTEGQIEEAFSDASRMQKLAHSLVDKAKSMSEEGKVMGA